MTKEFNHYYMKFVESSMFHPAKTEDDKEDTGTPVPHDEDGEDKENTDTPEPEDE